MSKPSSGTDAKKPLMIALAVLCLAGASYLVYRNFAEPTPTPLPPPKPEETKTSEPAPLPPNVNRPKPG